MDEPETRNAEHNLLNGGNVALLLNRIDPAGSAARRHGELAVMTAAERRERAAEILATGLVRALQKQGKARLKEEADDLLHKDNERKYPRLRLVRDVGADEGGEPQ